MADIRQKFGERLRRLRRGAGLTQEQLAAKADISVDFLSLVERGINAPSFSNLEKLARALGVPIRELFDFQNDEGSE
jgi:transcriptional regulator with XRE-family HTH domain